MVLRIKTHNNWIWIRCNMLILSIFMVFLPYNQICANGRTHYIFSGVAWLIIQRCTWQTLDNNVDFLCH